MTFTLKAWSHHPVISSCMPTFCQRAEACQFTSPGMTQSKRTEQNGVNGAWQRNSSANSLPSRLRSWAWIETYTQACPCFILSTSLTPRVSTKWMNNKWPKRLLQRSTWITVFFSISTQIKHNLRRCNQWRIQAVWHHYWSMLTFQKSGRSMCYNNECMEVW